MRAKIFLLLIAPILIVGCSTMRSVAELEGQGTVEMFGGSYDEIWDAAINACQSGVIRVVNSNKKIGRISAKARIRATSWGENISVWVREIDADYTEVEVVSRKAGPAIFLHYNWEEAILRNIRKKLDYVVIMLDENAE